MTFLRIESVQKAECFDCGKARKIYGVQKVFLFHLGGLPQVDTLKLPPLPDGWSWQPTCRQGGKGHEEFQ